MFTFVIFISGSAPDFTHQEANFFVRHFIRSAPLS